MHMLLFSKLLQVKEDCHYDTTSLVQSILQHQINTRFYEKKSSISGMRSSKRTLDMFRCSAADWSSRNGSNGITCSG
jgi:hypothetical protein